MVTKRPEGKAKDVDTEARDDPSQFVRFWDLYPNHRARADAMKAWRQMLPDPAVIFQALEAQILDRRARQGKGLWNPEWPYPASWLRGKRWEDAVEIPVKTPVATKPGVRPRAPEECKIGYGQEMDGDTTPPYKHGPADETGYCERCRKFVVRK